MSDKPLNCPLCGSEVEEHFLCYNDVFMHQFVCKDCGLESKVKTAETLSEAREKSIAAWNQRKPMEKIIEKFNELEHLSFSRISKPLIDLEDAIKIVKEEGGLNE